MALTTLEKYELYLNPTMARLYRMMGLENAEQIGHGCYVWDAQGRQYLDCLGGYGVFSLGHSHPKVRAALQKQLSQMALSTKILPNRSQADLAEALAQKTASKLQKSFFINSGAEAVECALKLARAATGRTKIICMEQGFHGKTFGALSATGRSIYREPFMPLVPGFCHIPFNDYEALSNEITDDTAAVLVEPVQGEGGIQVPAPDYLWKVRQLCYSKSILLICDEVQTGFGRTGRWFACEHYGVEPDILILGKALGGGLMPIGAVVATDEVFKPFIDQPLLHTSTFGGNPLACEAALATIQVLEEENLIDQSEKMGTYFKNQLQELQRCHSKWIREVRGLGLMLGLELVDVGMGGYVLHKLLEAGILVAYTLNQPKVIRLEPPLLIEKSQIDHVIAVFDQVFTEGQGFLTAFTKEESQCPN